MKAIVSSKTLYSAMPHGTRVIMYKNKYLYFSNFSGLDYSSIQVEAKGDEIHVDISEHQADTIIKVLRVIPEQPITIFIDGSNFGISMMVF